MNRLFGFEWSLILSGYISYIVESLQLYFIYNISLVRTRLMMFIACEYIVIQSHSRKIIKKKKNRIQE